MANEFNIDLGPSRTGLTVTAQLISGNLPLSSPVTLTESGTATGHYSGNMPMSINAGVYGVRFLAGNPAALVGTGFIAWDGSAERTTLNLSTASAVAAIPTNPLLTNDARLNNLDTTISSRLSSAAYTEPPTPTQVWEYTSRTLTTAGISAADVWNYSGRSLDGTQAANIASIASIPTNPLLSNDVRLDNLDAAISSRSQFNHATNQVIVATNNDKTNYQLADNAITSSKIQNGALTEAKFATGALNSVWSATTRTLTSISDSTGVTTLLSRITDLLPTKTEFDARTLPSSQYSTAANLDSVLTRTARVDALIENSGGDRFTTKALEATPSSSSGDNAATIYTYFTSLNRENVFKADVSPVLTAIAAIPTNPLLANAYVAPDNAGIAAIKAKTDQLTFISGDVVSTLNGEEVVISTTGVNAIVAGVNGALTIPTAVQIRTEIDNNSTQLAAIKTIATAAKNNAVAGL